MNTKEKQLLVEKLAKQLSHLKGYKFDFSTSLLKVTNPESGLITSTIIDVVKNQGFLFEGCGIDNDLLITAYFSKNLED